MLKIVQLPADLWRQYRDLRLEALSTDPDAFCATYQQELDISEAQRREFIHNIWFARVDNKIVGMVGLLPEDFGGLVISLWVKPAYRGQGIGKKLMQQLQAVARERGMKKLSLLVNSTQGHALKLYESLGFL